MNSSNFCGEVRERSDASSKAARVMAVGFVFCCMLPFALARDFLWTLVPLILKNDTLSQVPIVPVVSALLIWARKDRIFSQMSRGWALGAAFTLPGIVFFNMARLNVLQLPVTNRVSLFLLGVVLFWVGTFALFFGNHAFRTACFPLFFLIFAVPIPEPFLSLLIYYLQKGSASAAAMFFRLVGVPYLQQGFEFALPGARIRVAEECSGIRSTLAILITSVLACHLFLHSLWKKLVLCIVVVPIAIIKNGLRIMVLSSLAIYVNPGFLHGKLHHYGGLVFFAFALVPMILLLLLFQKGERTSPLESSTG